MELEDVIPACSRRSRRVSPDLEPAEGSSSIGMRALVAEATLPNDALKVEFVA